MKQIKAVGMDISLNNLGIVMATISLNHDLTTVQVDEVNLISPDKADIETRKQVRKNSDDLRRARWLQSRMMTACKGYDVAIVEMPVGSQSARAMASYGICMGVLASCPIPMIEVTPNDVKLSGAGYKTASKSDMIKWAADKHSEIKWLTVNRKGQSVMTNKNEHIADALAAIYAGMKTTEFKMMAIMAGKLHAF
jgi:hypothetical protein